MDDGLMVSRSSERVTFALAVLLVHAMLASAAVEAAVADAAMEPQVPQEEAAGHPTISAVRLSDETQRYLQIQAYKERKRVAPGRTIARAVGELEFLVGCGWDHIRTLQPDSKRDCECMGAILDLLRRSEPGAELAKLASEFLRKSWRGRTIRPELYNAMHAAIALLGQQRPEASLLVLEQVASSGFWESRAWKSLMEPAQFENETRQDLILSLRAAAARHVADHRPADAEAMLDQMAREARPDSHAARVIAVTQSYATKVRTGESARDLWPLPIR